MHPSQATQLPWIKPERSSPVSLQLQIARWLEELIVSGKLGPGERLPSEAVRSCNAWASVASPCDWRSTIWWRAT